MQVDWFIHFPLVIPIQGVFERGIVLEPLSQPITGIENRSADLIQKTFIVRLSLVG